MTWQVLVATVIAVLVAGFLVVLFLVRDPRSRRIRFGVFLEREQEPSNGGGISPGPDRETGPGP